MLAGKGCLPQIAGYICPIAAERNASADNRCFSGIVCHVTGALAVPESAEVKLRVPGFVALSGR